MQVKRDKVKIWEKIKLNRSYFCPIPKVNKVIWEGINILKNIEKAKNKVKRYYSKLRTNRCKSNVRRFNFINIKKYDKRYKI